MNKRQIIASLNKIANELDTTGLHKEANSLTDLMIKLAQFDGDMGGDDPNIAREFDATENADKFMTKEYTIILKFNEERMLEIPAERVIKGYMFDLKSLINSLRKAGIGAARTFQSSVYDNMYDTFSDGWYPEIDRENKTITLSVNARYESDTGFTYKLKSDNPSLQSEVLRASDEIENRQNQQRQKSKEISRNLKLKYN